MQNRYIGDIGDYSKFVLLKQLFNNKKCGIIWYLYPNEKNNDGEIRNYEKYKNLKCHKIINLMKKFESKERNIHMLEKILNKNAFNLIYFNKCIEKDCNNFFSNWRDRIKYREKWFKNALETIKQCDVVFVDPDNGIQIKSCPTKGSKKSGKYIYYDEIKELFKNHKTIIIYQHFTRQKHYDFIKEKELELRNELKNNFNFYAIKFKIKSPRTYLILSKEDLKEKIQKFCDEFKNEFDLIRCNNAI